MTASTSVLVLLWLLLGSFQPIFAEDFFLKKFGAKEGELSPRQIHDVLEDQRGIIYVADEAGVMEYDGIQWRKISMPQAGAALALGTDQNGRVYVAGPGEIGFLSPDSNGRMEFISLSQHLSAEQKAQLQGFIQVQSLGLKMAFVTDRRIFIWGDNAIAEYQTAGEIHSALGWKDQLLIVDNKQGLLRLQGKEIKAVEGGAFFSASTLTLEKDGRIWGGSLSDGLIELVMKDSSARFHSLPKLDKTVLLGTTVSRIRQVKDKVFVATIGKGLSAFSSTTGASVAIPEKLKKDLGLDIIALASDSHNRLWVGTMQGMYVLTDSAVAETAEKIEEEKNGFFAFVRSCVSMKDQEVIFGGAFFQELGGVQTLKSSSLNRPELPFNQNALRFGYASNDLVNSEAIEYQTFLVGFDSEWTEWSQRTYREFTNLVWKKYVFQVKARRPDGTISPITTFELKILPPWYERYWFYLLQLGILMALVVIITYLRGWTNRTNTTDKLNGVVVGTIWGYSFSKVGVQGVIWAMSGGAAFLAIITNAFMGIFLKPMQKKLEAKIIRLEDRLIRRYKKNESENVDRTIEFLKKRPRFKPAIKAHPPLHVVRSVQRSEFKKLQKAHANRHKKGHPPLKESA